MNIKDYWEIRIHICKDYYNRMKYKELKFISKEDMKRIVKE